MHCNFILMGEYNTGLGQGALYSICQVERSVKEDANRGERR